MKKSDKMLFRVSEISLVYMNKIPDIKRPRLLGAETAYLIFKEHWGHRINLVEEVYMLLINSCGRVIGIKHLAMGGVAVAAVDIRMVFATAILAKASAIVFAHNHPSGATYPSKRDIELTEIISQAGKIMGIKLLDHLILSPFDEYFSFAEENLVLSQPIE